MKVKSRKDTVTGTKKIVLIDNLTLNESYDMIKDSMRWSTLNIQGYTTLFKTLRVILLQHMGSLCAQSDSSGHTSENLNGKPITGCSGSMIQFGIWTDIYSSSDKAKKKKTTNKGTEQERKEISELLRLLCRFRYPMEL